MLGIVVGVREWPAPAVVSGEMSAPPSPFHLPLIVPLMNQRITFFFLELELRHTCHPKSGCCPYLTL